MIAIYPVYADVPRSRVSVLRGATALDLDRRKVSTHSTSRISEVVIKSSKGVPRTRAAVSMPSLGVSETLSPRTESPQTRAAVRHLGALRHESGSSLRCVAHAATRY